MGKKQLSNDSNSALLTLNPGPLSFNLGQGSFLLSLNPGRDQAIIPGQSADDSWLLQLADLTGLKTAFTVSALMGFVCFPIIFLFPKKMN